MNVLEQTLYATTNVSASNFLLWSSMKNDVWQIGCSNISKAWLLVQSAKQRTKRAENAKVSVDLYLKRFVEAIQSGHINLERDENILILSVWLYAEGGNQVSYQYFLEEIVDEDQRSRLLNGVCFEMANKLKDMNTVYEEVNRLKKENADLTVKLRQKSKKRGVSPTPADDDGGDGMVDWNAGASKRTKPRKVTGSVKSPEKKTKGNSETFRSFFGFLSICFFVLSMFTKMQL